MNDINDILDNKDNDGIITLYNEAGEAIDFVEIAGIAYKGGFYLILQPVELLPRMGDDEALVFEAKSCPDGTDSLEIVLDDEIIDAVFAEYDRLYDEMEKKQ